MHNGTPSRVVIVGDQIPGILPVVPLEQVPVAGIPIKGKVLNGVDPMVEFNSCHILQAHDDLILWVKLLHGFVSLMDC